MPGLTRILALVMAGGQGERLQPLTRDRAKPAVPFGGTYRIIDFVLSNLVNSDIVSIYILTQYKVQPIIEHLHRGWVHRLAGPRSFIEAVPAQMQIGRDWYRGTADAVFQNLNLIQQFDPDVVVIFGADHVYKMNIRQMVDFHLEVGAKATVACIPIPRSQASAFGIMKVNKDNRVEMFLEKPTDPPPMPDKPEFCQASMGNYVFEPKTLREALKELVGRSGTSYDFGHDVFPALTSAGVAYAYNFMQNRVPGPGRSEEEPYWRDVGTIEAYFEANLDLKEVKPGLNLYNWKWPIMTASFYDPPAKFVFDESGRRGDAVQSIVTAGCILAGGYVKDSILGRNVFLDAGSEVRESILLDNVYIGPRARIRRAIIDKNVRIDAGQIVGYDPDSDRQRYHVSDTGIVVIPKWPETPETLERYL